MVFEIFASKCIWYWHHRAWAFDTLGAISYRCSIGTEFVSPPIDILGSRPWLFRVMWHHQLCDSWLAISHYFQPFSTFEIFDPTNVNKPTNKHDRLQYLLAEVITLMYNITTMTAVSCCTVGCCEWLWWTDGCDAVMMKSTRFSEVAA